MRPVAIIRGKVSSLPGTKICLMRRLIFVFVFNVARLKKISACCVESSGENFLIGTENGNIYVMDLKKFDVTDSVIYLDVVMQK